MPNREMIRRPFELMEETKNRAARILKDYDIITHEEPSCTIRMAVSIDYSQNL